MEYKKCNLCGSTYKPLEKVYEWDKEDSFDYYCSAHAGQVRAFHRKQEKDFYEHFRDLQLRDKYLSQMQRELWERVAKKYK